VKKQPAEVDAVVVGSGPNGLAAAITLARAGLSVRLLEASDTIGGGLRSAALTLPGFVHDVCSAVHPMGAGSPFFASLDLERHGLRWIQPEIPLAHPLDGGAAAYLHRSVAQTADGLPGDGRAYRRLFRPLAQDWKILAPEILRPILHVPRHPFALARFGLPALTSAAFLARTNFRHEPARALLAGLAAHSFLPMEALASSAIGLVLGMAGHAVGWPIPQGGSQTVADALAACLRSYGGEIQTGRRLEAWQQLPRARAILCDLSAWEFHRLAGGRMSRGYGRRLANFRHGPGVCKIDYALSAPIPWTAEGCRRAGTVHLGGTLAEIAAGEREVARGGHPERPFVLLAQQSLFDATRAPQGQHTLWAYCHVPFGSAFDMSGRIEAQIERFAPGFRDCILARHVMRPMDLAARNPNLAGGDISGGANDLGQFIARPTFSFTPYRTPLRGVYLCSSSTPPGGGVHGMCGWHAARAALRDVFGQRLRPVR
jgi:phytoene dehydrogenase-like protein